MLGVNDRKVVDRLKSVAAKILVGQARCLSHGRLNSPIALNRIGEQQKPLWNGYLACSAGV
jgi:hypothetical protein